MDGRSQTVQTPTRRTQLLRLHTPVGAAPTASVRTSPQKPESSGPTSPSSAILVVPLAQPHHPEHQNDQQLATFPPMPPPKTLHKQLSFQSSSSTGPGASSGVPSLLTHTYSMLEAQQSQLRGMFGGQHLKSPSISESFGSVEEDDRTRPSGFRSPLIEAMGPDGPIVPLPPPLALDPVSHRAYEPHPALPDVPLRILGQGMGGVENLQDSSAASFATADALAFSARRKSTSCFSQSGETTTSPTQFRFGSASVGGEGSRRNSLGLNLLQLNAREFPEENTGAAPITASDIVGAHLAPPPGALPAVPAPGFHSLQQTYPLAASCGDLPFGLKHDVMLQE